MGRIFQSGFETNSTTTGMEWSAFVGGAAIGTTNVRSGSYAGQIASLTSGANKQFRASVSSVADKTKLWTRFYFYFVTLASAENRIMIINDQANITSPLVYIGLGTDAKLRLYDEDGVIGSASATLSANTWYRIEVRFDVSGAAGTHIVTGRIDGTNFASATTRSISSAAILLTLGGNLANEANTAGEWWFDDVAINDDTGSFQNSFPGEGKIIHLMPNAAGDANGFGTQVGGTAGSSNNFTRVNEKPPDDATSYNASGTLNTEDLFNVENSGLTADDTMNVVAVNARATNLVAADATVAYKLEIEKTASGTKTQSAAIIPNQTTWFTNTPPLTLPPIVTYQDPDNADWTNTTLDSMQIGYKITAANTREIAVSNVWASVDYTPGTLGTTGGFFNLM